LLPYIFYKKTTLSKVGGLYQGRNFRNFFIVPPNTFYKYNTFLFNNKVIVINNSNNSKKQQNKKMLLRGKSRYHNENSYEKQQNSIFVNFEL